MTKQILIVEDDQELQEYYAIMLEALDCQISHVFDGGQALVKLHEEIPDLIILDILLDEMMGDAVFLYLKQDPRYAQIPIIIASVLPPESSAKLLGLDPRTTYLQKPFTRRQLLQIVRDKCLDYVDGSA